MAGEIVNSDDKSVTVDLNHPLAGYALCYTVKLMNISQDPGEL
jgi:FKBP-type peptidyl-prolyl cis-trans isomerase 2